MNCLILHVYDEIRSFALDFMINHLWCTLTQSHKNISYDIQHIYNRWIVGVFYMRFVCLYWRGERAVKMQKSRYGFSLNVQLPLSPVCCAQCTHILLL